MTKSGRFCNFWYHIKQISSESGYLKIDNNNARKNLIDIQSLVLTIDFLSQHYWVPEDE